MVEEINNNSVTDDEYDPDAPPEREPFEFTGELTVSARVNNIDEATAIGFGENYRRYCEASSRPVENTVVWVLQAVARDGVREDGNEFFQSDIIPLQSKKGTWLTDGMAPDQVASAFRECSQGQLTASYRAAGAPNSAVGRVFRFKETEIKLGKSGQFTKRVSLWPVELLEEGVSVEQTKNYPALKAEGSDATPEAPADASPEDVKKVAKVLAGGTRTEAFSRLMGDSSVKGIARVLGHDLIQAATDDKLPDLLIEAGYLVESNGTLQLAGS